jgi:glutamate formiminotransferase
VLEAVPNVSEGRDESTIAAIGEAFGSEALLLDVHADVDHNRSVFTLAGDEAALVDSLLGGIAESVARIDLLRHAGVHPRIGVADVVPLVPLDENMAQAVEAAHRLARRVGDELALPVFLYAQAAEGVRPAFFRRGSIEELTRRVDLGELTPDAGPSRLDPRSGAVLVGARKILVAYNLELRTSDGTVAREIAARIRGSSGGMPGVQAIGLVLPSSGRVQLSMNVIDLELAPVHEVVRRVVAEARERGVEVAGGELVGLVPERVLADAERAGVELPGIDEGKTIERALARRP